MSVITTAEAALRKVLIDSANVRALVTERVYPVEIPQNTQYPCVSYFRVNSRSHQSLEGAHGLIEARFQFDCWATAYKTCVELRDAVRDAILDWFRGTIEDITITGITHELDTDVPEPEPNLYHGVAEFTVWYRRAQ